MNHNNHNSHNKGKHILVEFWDCQCQTDLLNDANKLQQQLQAAINQQKLTIVGVATHQFNSTCDSSLNAQNSGVTLSFLLAESHVCLHTWGEYKSVTLDIYVCNFMQDNSQKADNLLSFFNELFQPKTANIQEIWRQHRNLP